ncbi:response regulator transcription factor [Reichenbachiella sp. MALMAid0571]|uniref:response regulator transcription factor n=1 Tax=Reichenbachiella sp. MALMAid0571 TaxID=3143939 RepID=UPI0032DFD89D
MKVFLVDDHAIMLDGLVALLKTDEEMEIVGTAGTVAAAMEFLKMHHIDVLVTDYNLPDDDGLTLVRKVKRLWPEIKILVLSMHNESHLVKEILKEGIDGYVLKKDSKDELIDALYSVKKGNLFVSNEINGMLVRNLHQPDEQKLLTEREREILKLIAKEFTNKMIAEELFISERTVETHRKNIFRKTKTNSLVGLIKFAYANNLI